MKELQHWVKAKAPIDLYASYTDGRKEVHATIPEGQIGHVVDLDGSGRIEVYFPEGYAYCEVNQLLPAFHMEAFEEANFDILRKDVKAMLKEIKDYDGHHCSQSGEYQFNIKVCAFDWPDRIEACDEDAAKWDHYSEQQSQYLEGFVGSTDYEGGLVHVFKKWINQKWHTAGRSGGWLVLRLPNAEYDDLDNSFCEAEDDYVNQEGEHGFHEYLTACVCVIDTHTLLNFIEKDIELGKAGFKKFMASEEAWEDFDAGEDDDQGEDESDDGEVDECQFIDPVKQEDILPHFA